jgi:hypothetical protein
MVESEMSLPPRVLDDEPPADASSTDKTRKLSEPSNAANRSLQIDSALKPEPICGAVVDMME